MWYDFSGDLPPIRAPEVAYRIVWYCTPTCQRIPGQRRIPQGIVAAVELRLAIVDWLGLELGDDELPDTEHSDYVN